MRLVPPRTVLSYPAVSVALNAHFDLLLLLSHPTLLSAVYLAALLCTIFKHPPTPPPHTHICCRPLARPMLGWLALQADPSLLRQGLAAEEDEAQRLVAAPPALPAAAKLYKLTEEAITKCAAGGEGRGGAGRGGAPVKATRELR